MSVWVKLARWSVFTADVYRRFRAYFREKKPVVAAKCFCDA